MPHRALTYYARQYLNDPGSFTRTLIVPLLVWELPPSVKDDAYLLGTLSGVGASRATSRDPLVFELRKGDSKQNAFGFGITVGRTENNDIAIDDNSVSRFHAYFQEKRSKLTLVDAESRNGTWVDGEKLIGKAPRPLELGAKIKFGSVETTLLSPASFITLLKEKMEG